MANQAAYGAGNWSSDQALRNAFFAQARDQYFAMCLESRGWRRGDTPLTPAELERSCQTYTSETRRQECLDLLHRAL